MNKWLSALFLAFFPVLVCADDSISFAPPASDYSIVFLGNLFGVVDGVLHGTGSQIMGTIFSVFNSAVLALGGIIIMYTLIVSTMNTAHEGQMLGQKWSSIWIPARSTLGLALLIPKASGYCLMQIFVMWVVTQGVGAADKVWEAALGYLNRGGVIIQSQGNPAADMIATVNGQANAIPLGAFTILTGQVCMLGIQKKLEAQRKLDLQPAGRCNPVPSSDPANTCSGPIPNFLDTVNFVEFQQNNTAPYSMPLPNFASTGNTVYSSAFDGMCGTVTWNAISDLAGTPQTGQTTTLMGQAQHIGAGGQFDQTLSDAEDFATGNFWDISKVSTTQAPTAIATLTSSQLQTAQLSRAIAIQQMYVDLSLVAQTMIGNDPNFTSNTPNETTFSPIAIEQFGVPYTAVGAICSTQSGGCTTWGPVNNSGGVLFNGTEFAGAILDYNGVMKPTLSLINEIKTNANTGSSRAFIAQANTQGWIMAGAYFFDLVNLNGNAETNADLQDTNSGLDNSTPLDMTVFTSSGNPHFQTLNSSGWLNNNGNAPAEIGALINGYIANMNPAITAPIQSKQIQSSNRTIIGDPIGSSTVYGFINNSMMVQIPGQPGMKKMTFANTVHFNPGTQMYYLPPHSFPCGNVKTFTFTFCLGGLLGDIFYNGVIMVMYNALVFFFQQMIQQVVMAFIMIPIDGMAYIFKDGLNKISQPGVNPIIALSNMGIYYINFAGNLWMGLMAMAITSALIPLLGIFIFALCMFAMPLLTAWIGIMVSVGFTTAYYIPILPYMIFTFGAIGWLMAVIEAMVAAPIVALGVTHPEGHDAFGKGEAAVMLLMNVFLRPAMMIIGYISAIALSYVSVWILNSGFQHAIGFIQTSGSGPSAADILLPQGAAVSGISASGTVNPGAGSGTGASGADANNDWAGIFSYFFSILLYTSLYLTVVQKSFTLISSLPDKVLRWIGGSPESIGGESAQWTGDVEKKAGEGGGAASSAQGQMTKQLGGAGQKAAGTLGKLAGQGMSSGKVSGQGTDGAESTPSGGAGGIGKPV